MREYLKFYIDGQWVDPVEPKSLDVDNPTTEQVSGGRSASMCCRRSSSSTRSGPPTSPRR
jgi:hypothetical protein